MLNAPANPRVVAFFDAQNLFHTVKNAFGYHYPNFCARKLAEAICFQQGWTLNETRLYTGLPDSRQDNHWHKFWTNKTNAMKRAGDFVYTRPLRYQRQNVTLPDGTPYQIFTKEEKGIDVRIAIDIITLARRDAYDVALVFSQDQDLSEAAKEIRDIAIEKQRWIKIASAFPQNERNRRGINNTDWSQFDKTLYDQCIDPTDYRV